MFSILRKPRYTKHKIINKHAYIIKKTHSKCKSPKKYPWKPKGAIIYPKQEGGHWIVM